MVNRTLRNAAIAGLMALGGIIGAEAIGGYCSRVIGTTLSNIDSFHGNIGQYCQYKQDYDRVKAGLRGKDTSEEKDGIFAVFPSPDCIERWPLTPTNEVKITTSDGKTVVQRHATREHIDIKDIPKHVRDAFILREDKQFYDHNGINWRGKLRGIFRYLTRGSFGGTGITEQVSKLTFTERGRLAKRNGVSGVIRKLEEVVYATELDHRLGKDKILEFYINNAPLGNGNFGIGAAARDYFGKDVEDLSLAESLFLAVIPKNPGRNPKNGGFDFQNAQYINFLTELHKNGLIDDEQFEECLNGVRIKKAGRNGKTRVTYDSAVKAVREELLDFGIDLYDYLQSKKKGKANPKFENPGFGFTVNTSLDSKLTQKLKAAIDSRFRFKPRRANLAAAVLDNNGRIAAIIGRTNYKTWADMNLAIQGRYPMASTMKTFYYALAYELGLFDPKDEFYDDKDGFEIRNNGRTLWLPGVVSPPRNWDRTYGRLFTLERALANSNNVISRRIYDGLLGTRDGWSRLLHYIGLLGFDVNEYKKAGPDERNNNVLGVRRARVVDVAAAYNVFANNGIYFKPRIIDSLELGDEKIERKSEGVVVFRDPKTIEAIKKSLGRVARNLVGNGFDGFIGMKTGTASETVYAWIAGLLESRDREYSYAFLALNEYGKSIGKDLYASEIVAPAVRSFIRKTVPMTKVPAEAVVASLEENVGEGSYIELCRTYSDPTDAITRLGGYEKTRDEAGLSLARQVLDGCANESTIGTRDWTSFKFLAGDASDRLYRLSVDFYGGNSAAARLHLRNAMDAYKLVELHGLDNNYSLLAEARYGDLKKEIDQEKKDL